MHTNEIIHAMVIPRLGFVIKQNTRFLRQLVKATREIKKKEVKF